jgi:hypothetical protein
MGFASKQLTIRLQFLGKAGVEGVGTGAVTYAQTGGDLKEAGKSNDDYKVLFKLIKKD